MQRRHVKQSIDAIALPEGSILAGDYEIEAVLGSGGFGITYLGADRKLHIPVAIKEYLPRELGTRASDWTVTVRSNDLRLWDWGLERFVMEAQILARLRHPNIVRVLRTFKENNTAYIAFDYVEGMDMETWLRELNRPISQEEADALFYPLIDALDLIHREQYLHRDLKPGNIRIRTEDGMPVLLDFGASSAVSQISEEIAAIVTPRFSAPEQYHAASKQQGPWTDIYGLAATMYRAITGRMPVESVSRLMDDALEPCTSLPELSDFRFWFLRAVDQGLAVSWSDRPQSISAWRRELYGGTEFNWLNASRVRRAIGSGIDGWYRARHVKSGGGSDEYPTKPSILAPGESPNGIVGRAPQTVITVMLSPDEPFRAEVDRWIESNASESMILRCTSETDVFLSYHSEDRPNIERLAKAMQVQGWRVFWDRNILPGDRWEDVIEHAIEAAKCVVVVWTAKSVLSNWVREEASLGRERGVLVPVMMEATRIPLGFKAIQSADLTNWDGTISDNGFQIFVAGVRRQISRAHG